MVATNRSLESAPRFQPGLPDMSKPPSQQRDGSVWMCTSDVGQDSETAWRGHQEGVTPAILSAVELWCCFIWGLICMSCGILGLWMTPSQAPPSVDTAPAQKEGRENG